MANYKIIGKQCRQLNSAYLYGTSEALEQAAKDPGISIKVETHGQIGVENVLTEEEYKMLKLSIVIAADK